MAVLVSQPLLPLVPGFAIVRIARPELNEHFQARKPLTFFLYFIFYFLLPVSAAAPTDYIGCPVPMSPLGRLLPHHPP